MPNAKRVFFAPRESEAHKILLREAAKTGAIAPVLRELLCVMNADPDLIAFPTACQHLEEIITAIKQTWKADPATWGLDRYDATLQWVQSTRMSLRSPKNIGEKYDPENITLNPMFGNGMYRHPLYTLLLSTHANSEDHSQSRYRLVQAHVLVGIIAALQLQYPSQSEQDLLVDAYEAHGTPEEWKPLSNSIRDVCLSARRLALAEKP